MITLLHGTNRLAIDERVQALRLGADPSGLNTSTFDDAAQSRGDLQLACGAVGFFGVGRVVVARALLTPPTGRRRKKSAANDDEDLSWLGGLPTSTHLIIVEGAVDSATERELRRVVAELHVERHDVPRGRDLVEWACDRARRHDAVINPDAAERVLDALFPGSWQAAARRDDTPPNLLRLDSELAKLAVAAGRGGKIAPGLVAELVAEADADNLWGLTNAIGDGDASAAVREVERALAGGTAPEALIGQVAGQLEVFAALAAAGPAHDLGAIASITGLSEPRLRQASRLARRFPAERVRDSLSALRRLDLEAKQGRAEAADGLVGLVALLAAGTAVD